MSDTLEERLNRHSDSLQGLLSLIPAKYYFDEETQNQWQRKKSSKAEKRDAKKAKLDPLNGSSAADEAKRRAKAALEKEAEDAAERTGLDDSDSDISVIYDDNGNEIRLKPESDSESEEVEAKELPATNAPPTPQPTPKAQSKATPKAQKKAEKKAEKAKKEVEQNGVQNGVNGTEKTKTKTGTKNQKLSKDTQNGKTTATPAAEAGTPGAQEDAAADNDSAAAAKQAGIAELRQKLQDRINKLREERRAPGTSAPGAPKSREELLAIRKQRLEQKKLKRKRPEQEQEVNIESDDDASAAGDVSGDAAADELIYGGVSFKDGHKVTKELSINASKDAKKRSIKDQLKVVEARKKKIAELDDEKRKDVEDKAQWSRLILQSEGAKLRDNEGMLKKALKQKQNKKLKSELEWNERKRKVADGIAAREAKRNQNIANHTIIKQAKGKKQKKKLRQRAGFEGKRRKN